MKVCVDNMATLKNHKRMDTEERLKELREKYDALENNPEAQRRVAMEIERLVNVHKSKTVKRKRRLPSSQN